MQVTPAYLSSVATFYDMLRTEPTGPRYVYVCTSVACHLRNAKAVYDAIAEEARDQGLEGVEVREFECLGACDMAPMASVDGRYVGPLDEDDAHELVAAIKESSARCCPGRGLEDADYRLPWATEARGVSHPESRRRAAPSRTGRVGARGHDHRERVLTANIDEPGLHTIEVYERLGGYRSAAQGAVRHGAGGGAHRARGVRPARPRRRRLLDGQEGQLHPQGHDGQVPLLQRRRVRAGHVQGPAADAEEPAPAGRGLHHRLDRRRAPTRAFIFIRGEYATQADILDAAVEEAYAKGYLGEGIFGSEHDFELVVHRGQGAYICGEESALLDALEGKRGNPRLKPPFPANQGLYQGPTLINNVETLCNAPLIIEKGAEWFEGLGVGNSTGTKVVSVSGNVQRPGNYEIELGITGREIVYGLAGGPPEGTTVKCWFPGGSSAPVLLDEHLDLPYTFEAMAEAGSMLGSGAIIVVDDSASRSCRWRCAWPSSTATSPAASACPAARAPTGR